MRKDKISNVSRQINKLIQALNGLREEVWDEQLEIDPKDTDKIEEHTEAMKNINSMITHVENTMKIVKKRLDSPTFSLNNTDLNEVVSKKTTHKIKLSKESHLKFKKPVSVEFLEDKKNVRTWTNWAVYIINELIKNNEINAQDLTDNSKFWGRKRHYFDINNKNMKNPKKLDNGIYFETNRSAESLRDIIIDVLNIVGINPNKMTIYLKNR